MAEFEPKQFGKYYLIEKLAVGGMAEIYKAKTFGVDGFEKELAIKRILPHCSADKDFIGMLIDEAKLSVLLSHANIVQVYDLGKVGDDYFISMEFIHGVNLRDIMYRCREGKIPIPIDIAVYIISEICKGLDYAHRKTDQHNVPVGIVHRDISPQNVLISHEGEVKIVDFGIAKAAMNISHTMAGILKGKIAYMSPEQAMGKPIDQRTDIFSTGILLYETITGTKLYTGESQFEVLKKIRTSRITTDNLPEAIPTSLRPVLAKALAYDTGNRYQNAGDFQIDLTKYLYSTHIDFSPRKLAAFIKEIFLSEIQSEQVDRAREAALDQQTSSMNVAEGARQLEIVHREASYSEQDITARAKGVGEAFIETVMAPVAERRSGTTAASQANESITKKKGKDKNSSKFRKIVAAVAIILVAGLLIWRLIPTLHIWSGKKLSSKHAVPPPIETVTGIINVTSNPADAHIIVNDTDTGFVTPAQITSLPVGENYAIRLEKENFSSAEKTVSLSTAEPVDVMFSLTEATGMLNVISDPTSAAIMLDGKLTGLVTPAAIEKLSLNKDYKITITKPDYEDFEQVIKLTTPLPQKLTAKLTSLIPKGGKLEISSEPSGASVLLNGKETGKTTPTAITNLQPKKYSITLAMNGYDSWIGSFEIGPNQSVPVSAILKKLEAPVSTPTPPPGPPPTPTNVFEKGSLRVTSVPTGAKISLDGRQTGQVTPSTIGNLKIGSSYSVRLDLEGYKSSSLKKNMKKENDTLYAKLVPLTPEPIPPPVSKPPPEPEPTPTPEPEPKNQDERKPGKVRIASTPSGADVFINSEHKGQTPLTVPVPPGSVNVLVSKDGARVSRTITVKPGQTVSLGDLNLGSAFGEVSIQTDPPRAQVTFDGQTIPAPTPVTIRKVTAGRQHNFTVSLPGYHSVSKSFSMDGGSKSFRIELQPQ